MKMKQYLILTLATVFFTACGSKKESAQQSAEVQKQEPAAPAPTVSAEEQAKLDAEKEKARIAAEKAKEGRGAVDTKRSDKKAAVLPKKTVPKKGPAKGTDGLVSTQELQLTGGRSEAGMVYTGSSADFIITKLVAEEKSKATAEFDRNAKFAANVWDMAYIVDSSGLLWIDIQFIKGSGLSKVQVKTPYQAGKLMHVSANTGSSSLDVSAECLDSALKPDLCSNLLVTFVHNGAQATAVLRQTSANIWFEYQTVQAADDYAQFVDFFKNARLDVETPNKLDRAYLHTFEVVNGKSGFKAVITGKHNQVIAFEADLLLKGDLSAPMINVMKETKFTDIDLWMGRIAGKDLAYSRSISDAKLVQNSTKGQITIDMKVNAASGAKHDFTIKFTRVPVAASL